MQLTHIARFLAEFGSKREAGHKAPFLRAGVGVRMLDLFSVFPDVLLREFIAGGCGVVGLSRGVGWGEGWRGVVVCPSLCLFFYC